MTFIDEPFAPMPAAKSALLGNMIKMKSKRKGPTTFSNYRATSTRGVNGQRWIDGGETDA
jgi:hypothetical protein